MEQDDGGSKRQTTPPPPTPAPHRPQNKPYNIVHSSPSVIPGTQTQMEGSQRESSNRAWSAPKTLPQSRPKKSVVMRPVPVVTVDAFKRAKETPASQIEEFSSPERQTKKTALTEGMNWPEKSKPPIQKRPLEDILSKSKSQTVGPVKGSTPQPASSRHPPLSRGNPHKAAKGRPGVDAKGSQDPKGKRRRNRM
jgi:type II secretory pathway component HofQ